jgi:formate hydrogenlyase subunit 3/multisubunit Na+/H+ antiporter MnhD subunit
VLRSSIRAVAAPAQRRALGALFAVLALAFAGIAVAAGGAGKWVIAVAAAALAVWMGGSALRGLRR